MKQVVIYSTPTCTYCNQAKEFFKANNVAYIEHNVASDLEMRKQMVEATGQLGVPVISIGDEHIVGFQKEHIAELLGIK